MADFGWAFVKGGLVQGSAPPSGSVQYNKDGNFEGSSDLTFVSGAVSQLNLSGNLNVSGAINANEFNVNVTNHNVVNISATGSTKFGDSTDDMHIFTGSMEISTSANPLKLYGVQAGTPPSNDRYLALDSNYNLVLTSAAGAGLEGGTIGEAEDGTYTDGLFTDFVSSTPIGTAIDRINEILAILTPGPAPAVDRIDYSNTDGLGPKLGGATALEFYATVQNTGSFNDNLSVNSEFSPSTSGEDFRLGTYDGTQQIQGEVNFNTVEQLKGTYVNYSHNSFGNGESGSLNLYVNDSLVHYIDLASFTGTGDPNSGSATSYAIGTNTGFYDVSIAKSAQDQNGSEYPLFKHRTAKFVVDTPEQRKGWNIAKVEHQYGSQTFITNFVQWYNDTDASSLSMAVQNQRISFVGGGTPKYLSGVEYFRTGDLTYNAEVANFYKYTYPTGNVLTFNNSANTDGITAQSAPAIGGGEDFNKLFEITASTSTNDDTMLNDSATVSFNLSHHFKSDLSTAGTVSANEILLYNVNNASTNTVEYFDDETYRLVNGTYNLQSDVTSPSSTWNSTIHMNDATSFPTYSTGLLFYNSRLYSPKQGANGGDFASLSNGPTGNPNYSTVTGTKTFYRKIQNTLSSTNVYDLKITSTKNTKIDFNTLSTSNIRFSVKIPGKTGWMDISQNYIYGNTSDTDGALISSATDNVNTSVTSTGNSVHCVTFGTEFVSSGDYIVIKIEADSSWTSYIETLEFQLQARDGAAAIVAPVLDDVDLDNNGEDAVLSFGTSNGVVGYSNVTASVISSTDKDSNDQFNDDGDSVRGVFSSFEVMTGTLNEDVSANVNNYPANSFRNGYTGDLILEVNGTEVSTLDLTTTINAINGIVSDTGLSVSAVNWSATDDGIPDYTKPYRTGTYSIATSLQNLGWNYAKVIHRISGVDTTTNYVQWVVDTSGSTVPMASSNISLSNLGHNDVYYQSGVGYFASPPTGSLTYVASEVYSNVYSKNSNAISFPNLTNCSVSSVVRNGSGVTNGTVAASFATLPPLNNTADCEAQDLQVTGNIAYSKQAGGSPVFSIKASTTSGTIDIFSAYGVSVDSLIHHPLKTNLSIASQSKADIMFYSGSIGLTNLTAHEYFNTEDYRIVSGNYTNQSDVTSSSNTWDSTVSINDTVGNIEHSDGMVTVNGYLIPPFDIGVSGDTRNTADGGTLQAPAGNPDYSTLSNDVRTFYRYFYNDTTTNLASITVTLFGDAELVSKDSGSAYYGALGANKNIYVEIKSPFNPSDPIDQSTGWGDAAKPWSSSQQPTPANDGAGIRDVGNGDEQTIIGTGLAVDITFGNRRITAGSYYVVKISAHKDWTGYLSRISIS